MWGRVWGCPRDNLNKKIDIKALFFSFDLSPATTFLLYVSRETAVAWAMTCR
jgi:hypothetical protein